MLLKYNHDDVGLVVLLRQRKLRVFQELLNKASSSLHISACFENESDELIKENLNYIVHGFQLSATRIL